MAKFLCLLALCAVATATPVIPGVSLGSGLAASPLGLAQQAAGSGMSALNGAAGAATGLLGRANPLSANRRARDVTVSLDTSGAADLAQAVGNPVKAAINTDAKVDVASPLKLAANVVKQAASAASRLRDRAEELVEDIRDMPRALPIDPVAYRQAIKERTDPVDFIAGAIGLAARNAAENVAEKAASLDFNRIFSNVLALDDADLNAAASAATSLGLPAGIAQRAVEKLRDLIDDTNEWLQEFTGTLPGFPERG